MYTKKFGRQSFLIQGMRNRKAGKHNILFQPMFILDLVMYYKTSREMQNLKEFSVSFAPYNIHSNVKKSCVAIFICEILTSSLREESPNEELFEYIEKAIAYLDNSHKGYTNFHIAFLSGLTSFLGFGPGQQTDTNDVFFDMLNGKFVTIPPVHGLYANQNISNILATFFISSFDAISNINLTGVQRNEVLEILVKYYSLHLPGLKKIKSLEVLKEVFS